MFSKSTKASVAIATLASGLCLSAYAQEPNPTTIAPGARSAEVVTEGKDGVYIYHVKTVERQLDAVNYFNRSGSTHVGFIGTDLMGSAKGDAKVNAVTGKTNIDVHFEGLTQANGFGPEYLTYVLWAISSDGRPQNLGELELSGGKASLNVTTGFQSFGMIVTAEPYFAVSQPSDVVVLKNVFSDKDTGRSAASQHPLSASPQGPLRQHRRRSLAVAPHHRPRAHAARPLRGLQRTAHRGEHRSR